MKPWLGEDGPSTRITPRLLDLIGSAMVALYAAALAGLGAALWFDAPFAALLFAGAMVGCGVTLCAIGLFEWRLS